MKNLYKKISIVLMLFAVFIMTAPAQLAFANQKNKMIDEGYFDNPETFNQDSTAVKESAAVGLTAWDYIKMLLALIFVLLLLIWVLKFINKKSYHFQQNQIVRNIGGISVGSQKSVQILQIGDKLYIVGVGENVELIKEISNRDEIDKLLNLYNEKQMLTTSPPFIAELFKKLKGQSKTRENSNHSDFGNMLNQRLSEIQKMRRDELEKWKEKERDK